jgi:hypothetical protein
VHSLYLIRCGGKTCSLLLDLFQLHFFSSPYEPQPMVDLEAVDMQRDSRSKIMRLAIVLFLIYMIVQCSFLSLREKFNFLTMHELFLASLVTQSDFWCLIYVCKVGTTRHNLRVL